MKIASEFIHEMGHVLFVLMLGGSITGISIPVAWPFSVSYTKWVMANPSSIQFALIASAGILFDALTSIAGQSILMMRKKIRPVYALSLFWLSFWAYLSSVVYLVMGAIHPFGDVLDLITAVPVPRFWIGMVGAVLLALNTYSLSIILRDIFSRVLRLTRASEVVSFFWVLLHSFFVSITIVKYGLPVPPTIAVTVLVLIFIWSYIIGRWLLAAVSYPRGSRKKMVLPRSVKPRDAEPSVGDIPHRGLKLGYVALLSVALVSILLTGYMITQYLSTYRLVMKTDIDIEVTYFELNLEEPVMNLSVEIFNPTHNNLSLSRIEFDLYLNGKFMDHQALKEIPAVDPESQIAFTHALTLPLDRMFTVEQALKDGKWEWTVSGSGHVGTLFGETLLRFSSKSTLEPQEG